MAENTIQNTIHKIRIADVEYDLRDKAATDAIDEISIKVDEKSQVKMTTTEGENFLPTLNIHKLTQEEYEQKIENGTVEENVLYLTPYEDINLDEYMELLNAKADKEHEHEISDIKDLQGSLNDKVSVNRTINNKALAEDIVLSASDVGAAASSHDHNDLYYTKTEADTAINNINTSISNIVDGTTIVSKATNASEATHATSSDTATKAFQDGSENVIVDTYETKNDATTKINDLKSYFDTTLAGAETVINDALSNKADSVHNHDGLYYTENEVDELIANHNHDSLYDSIGSANTALETAKTYTDNAVAQKSLVQICKWEADD